MAVNESREAERGRLQEAIDGLLESLRSAEAELETEKAKSVDDQHQLQSLQNEVDRLKDEINSKQSQLNSL